MSRCRPCYWSTAFLLLGAVVAALVACSAQDLDARETPGEKREWSVLQTIELKSRGVSIREPVLQTVGEHEVLGVRGLKGENLWILLKPGYPPFYKQLPSGNYEIPKELVSRLAREGRVSYTVENVLETHVSAR
jgi:hypothetical protein